ncbi:hypothetical protein AB1Y20_009146 [Prymnesium parvum]|uniref:RPEL repeat protein n=1 Tax=Prymnesium parvum TaxID=97485 RepID=A0AB34K446_PRYPA
MEAAAERSAALEDPPAEAGVAGATEDRRTASSRRDSLDERLCRRPSLDQLVERGVIKASTGVSPGLVAKQAELEKSMRRDSLAQALDRRASAEELLQRNILKGTGVSARLAEASEALELDMRRSSLSHALLARPSISELQTRGILEDSPTVRAAAAQEEADRIELGMESSESLALPESGGGPRASIAKQSLLAKAKAMIRGGRGGTYPTATATSSEFMRKCERTCRWPKNVSRLYPAARGREGATGAVPLGHRWVSFA